MPNVPGFNIDYPEIRESLRCFSRARDLVPAQTQTLAKGPTQYVHGVAPVYAFRGKGARLWDVDGNEYIDYNMGIGPISLGYAYDRVDDAIRKQLESGITFSLPHILEIEVAEILAGIIPNAEMVRFSKAGNDVTSAAVRLARAYTGKNVVLCCGYHGWHDWYIAVTDRNAGIPAPVADLTYTFQYNDIQSVIDSIDSDTACVILEPVVFEEPKDNFLHELRRVCDRHGVLLIFDEMWTGFRLALGGAQEYYGVHADLACFSKAIANGMPLSVLTGKKEIMKLCEHDVFFFTTFGGEALSLAAARATLFEMMDKKVHRRLFQAGATLKDGLNKILESYGVDYIRCSGLDPRTMINFGLPHDEGRILKSFIQQELIKRGILWSGFHTVSYSHTDEDIQYTLNAWDDVVSLVRDIMSSDCLHSSLRGSPVAPVFRKTDNFHTRVRAK
jgi:glutamate-1-semialdehyde 2,1-aminomutase